MLIFESKGQRSIFLQLSRCTLFLTEYLYAFKLDASNFKNIWRMIIGKHPEHQRSKRLLVKVSNWCFPIEIYVFVIFVNSASISTPYMQFVIKVWWTFYVLNILFHSIDYFTCIVPERWDIMHVMYVIPSNWPTKVSLHWTWFKVGNPTQ